MFVLRHTRSRSATAAALVAMRTSDSHAEVSAQVYEQPLLETMEL